MSVHREENLDSPENVIKFKEILNRLGETYNYPIIVSTHPRTRKMFTNLGLEFHPLVDLQKPLAFSDYVNLQINSRVVLSDSGTITEESST